MNESSTSRKKCVTRYAGSIILETVHAALLITLCYKGAVRISTIATRLVSVEHIAQTIAIAQPTDNVAKELATLVNIVGQSTHDITILTSMATLFFVLVSPLLQSTAWALLYTDKIPRVKEYISIISVRSIVLVTALLAATGAYVFLRGIATVLGILIVGVIVVITTAMTNYATTTKGKTGKKTKGNITKFIHEIATNTRKNITNPITTILTISFVVVDILILIVALNQAQAANDIAQAALGFALIITVQRFILKRTTKHVGSNT